MATPNVIRAELIAQYRELESRGYVQNVEAFKAAWWSSRTPATRNRVDVLWPGTLINQLDVLLALAVPPQLIGLNRGNRPQAPGWR